MDSVAGILKQRRMAKGFTMRSLALECGISPSHLGRIEHGQRFPSAFVLRKLAKPLGFNEGELFTLAGFLSPLTSQGEKINPEETTPGLDPEVARTLSREPVQVQRAVIDILALLKNICQNPD